MNVDRVFKYRQRITAGIIGIALFLFLCGGCEMNLRAALGHLRSASASLVAKGGSWARDMLGWNGILGDMGGGSKLARPYEKSAWVMRAIKTVADPIASLPIQFYADRRRGDVLIQDGPVVEFWEEPFQGISRVAGVFATIAWLKLAGNAFWLKDDTWLTSAGARGKLIIARPDRMTPVLEGTEILGWQYLDKRGKSHAFLPPQVEHIKLWNPYDDVWGLPEWAAARIATEADYFAGLYNRNLMAGSGEQGDIVVVKSGAPSDAQRAQIINSLRERRMARQRGEFRPVILGGDIEVENPNVQALDAALVAQRLENRHEIFIAFGVPPSMADIKASYSIGADSDYARLIETTCMPHASQLCEHVENVSRALGESRAPRLWAYFNWDENSTIQAARRERIDAATKYWDRGMPWRTANDVLDLGLKAFPGWDVGYLPFSVAPVGSEGLAADADYAEEDGATEAQEPVTEMLRALRAPRPERDKSAAPEHACGTGKLVCSKASARDSAAWRSHMAQRRATTKAYDAKFRRELMKARAEVLAKIEQAARTELVASFDGSRIRAAASDFLFDLAKWKRGLSATMRRVAEVALKTAGDQCLKELDKDDPFAMPPARAIAFLQNRENKLSNVADEIFARLQQVLQEGLAEGDTMDELAKRARAEFNQMSRGRALRYAMTETAAAYGTAREEAMKQAGVQYKQWLTSGNANVRASHAAAAGQAVTLDEPFIVGAAELMFPGDPSGPPEEVINCHCVQIAVAAPAEEEEEA